IEGAPLEDVAAPIALAKLYPIEQPVVRETLESVFSRLGEADSRAGGGGVCGRREVDLGAGGGSHDPRRDVNGHPADVLAAFLHVADVDPAANLEAEPPDCPSERDCAAERIRGGSEGRKRPVAC